jgi:hypothetical protein
LQANDCCRESVSIHKRFFLAAAPCVTTSVQADVLTSITFNGHCQTGSLEDYVMLHSILTVQLKVAHEKRDRA